MSDDKKNDGDAPKTYTKADIEKREAENAKYRQTIRDLKEKVGVLEPKAILADELAAKNLTESEKVEATLADLQSKITEREAALELTKRKATLSGMMLEANVDPIHAEILNAALPSLQLDDKDKMAELLSLYAKKTAVNSGVTVNPAKEKTGEIDWDNLSGSDIDSLLVTEADKRASGW